METKMRIIQNIGAIVLAGALLAGFPAAASERPAAAVSEAHSGWQVISHDEWRRYEPLSPREVRRILRREGFRRIEFLDRRGRSYTARAEDWRGRPVIIRVSARSGAIISVQPVRRHRDRDDDRPRCWLPEGCYY
jgi:hypothetical protein